MNYKFKKYWRKAGLDVKWGNILLDLIKQKKPKNFLEVGVFCGVTSRNICEVLNLIHSGNFTYTGIDLFGLEGSALEEQKPRYITNQKFSNPLKHFYYNLYLKENLNSIESVKKFLSKFENKIILHRGDSNIILKKMNIQNIDFAFIDGGHSYQTTFNDLNNIYENVKNKRGTIVCDDYQDATYISDVKKAVDHFVKKENLNLNVIEGKFAVIEF